MRRSRALWTGNTRVPTHAPLKSTRGQSHLSHSGSAEWGPSQPGCRRFPDPSQVNLCPVSPLQGQEAFIPLGNATARTGAAPRGRGVPHSHPGCHNPTSCSHHTPWRAACPRGGAECRFPRGMRVGPGGALRRLSRSAGAAAGARRVAGPEGPLTPPSVTNDYPPLSGG